MKQPDDISDLGRDLAGSPVGIGLSSVLPIPRHDGTPSFRDILDQRRLEDEYERWRYGEQ